MIVIYNADKTNSIMPAYFRGNKILEKFESREDAEVFIKLYVSSREKLEKIDSIYFDSNETINISFTRIDRTIGDFYLGYLEN